jgi:hypothetical protein
MNKFHQLLLALVTTGGFLALTGCASDKPDTTTTTTTTEETTVQPATH